MPVCLPPAVSSSFLPTAGDTDEVESLLEEDEWLHVWVREQMKNHMAKVGEALGRLRVRKGRLEEQMDGMMNGWMGEEVDGDREGQKTSGFAIYKPGELPRFSLT